MVDQRHNCGELFEITDDRIDHDLDADHVPFGQPQTGPGGNPSRVSLAARRWTVAEHSEEKIPMTLDLAADALRDRIAQAIESVAHEPAGGRPCELCMETADAVLGALGIELVGVATEAGITSGGDFVATSASNASPGDVPLYRLVRDTEADRG